MSGLPNFAKIYLSMILIYLNETFYIYIYYFRVPKTFYSNLHHKKAVQL